MSELQGLKPGDAVLIQTTSGWRAERKSYEPATVLRVTKTQVLTGDAERPQRWRKDYGGPIPRPRGYSSTSRRLVRATDARLHAAEWGSARQRFDDAWRALQRRYGRVPDSISLETLQELAGALERVEQLTRPSEAPRD